MPCNSAYIEKASVRRSGAPSVRPYSSDLEICGKAPSGKTMDSCCSITIFGQSHRVCHAKCRGIAETLGPSRWNIVRLAISASIGMDNTDNPVNLAKIWTPWPSSIGAYLPAPCKLYESTTMPLPLNLPHEDFENQ